MKTLISLILILCLAQSLQAQYLKAYNEGKRCETKEQYYDAILAYNVAYNTPDKPATNDLQKRIDFCANQLKKQQDEIKLALKTAKEEKERADIMRVNSEGLLNIIRPRNIGNLYIYYIEKVNESISKGRYKRALDELLLASLSPECKDSSKISSTKNLIQKCLDYTALADKYYKRMDWHSADSIYTKILELNNKDENAMNRKAELELYLNPNSLKIKPFKTIDWSKIKYAKCIEREIEFANIENMPLSLPQVPSMGFKSLIDMVLPLIEASKLPAFKTRMDGVFDIQKSKDRISYNEIRINFDALDRTVMVEDIESGQLVEKRQKGEPKTWEITRLIVVELCLYNYSDQIEDKRVIGLIPIREHYAYDDQERAKPLFTNVFALLFKQCRPFFTAQKMIANEVSKQISFDEYFYNFNYRGKIINEYPISYNESIKYIEGEQADTITFNSQIQLRKTPKDSIYKIKYVNRIISSTDTSNKALFLPLKSSNGYKKLIDVLFDAITTTNIKVYATEFRDIDCFKQETTLKEINYKFDAEDKIVMVEDVETGNLVERKVKGLVKSEEVEKYIVKEAWVYNKNNELIDIEVIGLCPIRVYYRENDPEQPLWTKTFWIKYSDIIKVLNENEIINLNYDKNKSFATFFNNLEYFGEIEGELDVDLNIAYDELQDLYDQFPANNGYNNSPIPDLIKCNKLCAQALLSNNAGESELKFNKARKEFHYSDINRFQLINDLKNFLPELIYYTDNIMYNNIIDGGYVDLTKLKRLQLSNLLLAFSNLSLPIKIIFTNQMSSFIEFSGRSRGAKQPIDIEVNSENLKNIVDSNMVNEKLYRNKLNDYLIHKKGNYGLAINCGLTKLPIEIYSMPFFSQIDLSNNSLTELQDEIQNWKYLKTLNLANNKIISLPSSFKKLSSLENMNLSGNNLTSIPTVIGKLTNLTGLDLSKNQLSTLPIEIGKLTNLNELNLSGNQLTILPAEITKLTNLKSLNLENNPLPEAEKQKIKALLPKCEIKW